MSDIASKLVIISGPSGAGKDTIAGRLVALDSSLSIAVSATARKPRPGEKEGVDYYFFSEDDFLDKVEKGDFIEYAKYGSNYYGTLKSDVQNRIENGKTVILVIEVQGAANVRKMYPDALSIFIMPPSEEVLEKRLRSRMTDSEEAISKRMEIAKGEMKRSGEYDYTVVNDELEKAVKDTYQLIKNI